MSNTIPSVKDLYKAGAHFGHRRNHTDARSHKFIFGYKNKVAVIDLEKTIILIESALKEVAKVASEGSGIIFVGTKLQVKDLVKKTAESIDQSYVVERWPGGLITNYEMVSKRIKEMVKVEKELDEGKYDTLKKKEKLKIEKDLKKAHEIFGGLKNLERKPGLVFVVDAKKEMIAIRESKKDNIPVIGICDTNSNPQTVDFPIVANDDSKQTVEILLNLIAETYKENFKPKEIIEEPKENSENIESKKPLKPRRSASSDTSKAKTN